VWKSLHVAEEVVLRKQVTERTEKVRETVRRDVVDVEHAREAVPVLAYEVERRAEVRPTQHETEVERQKRVQPSTGDTRDHGEPQDNRRQQDELHDKKAGQGPQGPAPQPGARKS
jgi:hypothetical protein